MWPFHNDEPKTYGNHRELADRMLAELTDTEHLLGQPWHEIWPDIVAGYERLLALKTACALEFEEDKE